MEFDRNGYNEKHNCFRSRYYASKFVGDGHIYRCFCDGQCVYRVYYPVVLDEFKHP